VTVSPSRGQFQFVGTGHTPSRALSSK
jgi:hypothetical protein